jgi:nucleoside-diphosphate-sugar epimerase
MFWMRVLVTGHCGTIGRPIVEDLERRGHAVVGFDVVEGSDLLDPGAVRDAAAGCAAIIHLGALANDNAGTPERIMAVNVLGTWHVLLAAEAASSTLVVHFSSYQALGIAAGERLPDYFPVDDDHPRRATRPYGLSKHLAEDLCEAFTARTGIATISLRPVGIWDSEIYRWVEQKRTIEPQFEWEPYWEYGAFVDVRDVVAAVDCALAVPLSGHHRALLCATDIAGSAPSLQLAGRLAPTVPVREPGRYIADPWRALVDCTVAATVLGWRPRYRWSERERA